MAWFHFMNIYRSLILLFFLGMTITIDVIGIETEEGTVTEIAIETVSPPAVIHHQSQTV